MNDDQQSAPTSDSRPNKDWLQIWYKNCHSDIQWAKGQSWNAVQWSVVLLAAVFAASQTYTVIPACVWVLFTIAIAAVAIWWSLDLHIFARRTRDTAFGLIKPLRELELYLPKRSADPHHLFLLIARITVLVSAAVVTVIQILRG